MSSATLKPASQALLRVLPYTLFLYSIAVMTTMAGMELFGWLSALIVLAVVTLQWNAPPLAWRSFFLPVDVALGLLFLVVAGRALWSPFPDTDALAIIGSMRFILLFILIRIGLALVWSESMKKVSRFLIILGLLIALYTFFQSITGIDLLRSGDRAMMSKVWLSAEHWMYRVRGMLNHPVTFAYSMGVLLCIPLGFFFARSWQSARWHVITGITAAACLLSLGLSFTRGAWIAAAASVFVMSLYAGRRVAISIAVSAVLAFSGMYMFSDAFRGRIHSIGHTKDESSQERVAIWRANYLIFQDYPVFGIGYGENERKIQVYFERMGMPGAYGGHAHNNYLQFLAGTGIVGFSLFMFFILYFLFISHRLWLMIPPERRWERGLVLGAIGSQVFLHVGGMTEANFKDAEVNHPYMFILALVAVLYASYRVKGPKGAPENTRQTS